MPSLRFAAVVLAVSLLSFGVTMGASHLALQRPSSEFLTDDTQSHLRADYSADGMVMRVAPTRPEIVEAAADDEALLLQIAPSGQSATRIEPNLIPTPTPTPAPIRQATPTPALALAASPTPAGATPAVTATRPPLDVTSTPATQPTPPTPQPQATPQATAAVQAPTATPSVPPTPGALPPTATPVQQPLAPTATPYMPPTPAVPSPTPFVYVPPTPTRTPVLVIFPPTPTPVFFSPAATPTRTPTPLPPTPTFTPVVPTSTPTLPTSTPTAVPTATATPTSTPLAPTATPTATAVLPTPTATPAIPSGNAWLLLHRSVVSGSTHRMSNAIDGNANDQLDANYGSVELYQTLQPIAWASGTTDWVVQLVQRDKPNGSAPATIKVWSQAGSCTDFGAVPASQRYASGSVTIPSAVDHRGIAVGVTATGAPQRSFAVGEVLCLSILATSGSGSDDLHYYGDTFSASGLPGRSKLTGPFSFATAPYLLHQATINGNRSMSTSASGNTNDQMTVNAGSTVTFESTSPIKDASGLSPWPLHLVIRDVVIVPGSGQAQVWKQNGSCTSYTSVPVQQRLASGTFAIPIGLGGNGVSLSIPGTTAALTTFGPFDVLCVAISNTGLTGWTLRLDTQAANGTSGMTTLGGPFSQVAGARAYGPNRSGATATNLLPLLAAWVVLSASAGIWWRLRRHR